METNIHTSETIYRMLVNEDKKEGRILSDNTVESVIRLQRKYKENDEEFDIMDFFGTDEEVLHKCEYAEMILNNRIMRKNFLQKYESGKKNYIRNSID